MRFRPTSLASLLAIALSSLVIGCSNDAPEANVLDPGQKPNMPSGGATGVDGKPKDSAPAKTEG
jgi:hypothetical protein